MLEPDNAVGTCADFNTQLEIKLQTSHTPAPAPSSKGGTEEERL